MDIDKEANRAYIEFVEAQLIVVRNELKMLETLLKKLKENHNA